MTATISVSPCPSIRDFEHEGWTRLVPDVLRKRYFLVGAKHQAIQGDDTPADTTFPCVNL
eukprot:451-Pelagomonas_calceolata.AAC.1